MAGLETEQNKEDSAVPQPIRPPARGRTERDPSDAEGPRRDGSLGSADGADSAAIWRLVRTLGLWRHLSVAIVALTCAVVCFTTVGRLWYVPGRLLILATVIGFVWRRR